LLRQLPTRDRRRRAAGCRSEQAQRPALRPLSHSGEHRRRRTRTDARGTRHRVRVRRRTCTAIFPFDHRGHSRAARSRNAVRGASTFSISVAYTGTGSGEAARPEQRRKTMSRVNGGELFVRTVIRNGVDVMFTLHGGHLDAIFQSCLDHDLRLVDTRHEAAAGHAADAYARMTRKPGVALVTAGPGFTNVVTAIANAYLDCIPTLFVAGAPPLRDA